MQGFDGNEIVAVKLIDHPQQTMHLDLPICREGTKILITGEKNAAGVTFSKRERETVMDGELWKLPNSLLCTKNTLPGQVDNLDATRNKRTFLSSREFEQLVLEQGIRNQNLIGQFQEGVD